MFPCAPTSDELQSLLDKILARLMKMLTRQGYLLEEQGTTYLADIDADNPLRSLQAASCTFRIVLGSCASAQGTRPAVPLYRSRDLERPLS